MELTAYKAKSPIDTLRLVELVCEVFVRVCAVVINELRSSFGPFVCCHVTEPLGRFRTALLNSEAGMECLLYGDISAVRHEIRYVLPRKKNEFGEEMFAELILAVGMVQMVVECLSCHPAQRLFASVVYTTQNTLPAAEERALELLREHTTEEQHRMYALTGTVIHRSMRLPFLYLIRRGFPTLVFELKETDGGEGSIFRCALCAHMESYPAGHFSGVCCPTDDVILHLLSLRSDEDEFWNKSTVHLPTSGLIGL